jgi:hypothetical protein
MATTTANEAWLAAQEAETATEVATARVTGYGSEAPGG